jgi:hypothetical protein
LFIPQKPSISPFIYSNPSFIYPNPSFIHLFPFGFAAVVILIEIHLVHSLKQTTMKKIILLLAAITIGYANTNAQSCLSEGITFTKQAQIDNFQTNYPGCTEIEGDVTISGLGIRNLMGLSVLTSIGGHLSIGGSSALASIGGGLFIGGPDDQGNPSLTSLMGLENLASIGGSLSIMGNSTLTSLAGLDNLASIGGGIFIGNRYQANPSLTSLTGLENLTSIGGYLRIRNNHALTSLTGLENLTSIGGYLNIGDYNQGNPP